jgi:hypothetical protein
VGLFNVVVSVIGFNDGDDEWQRGVVFLLGQYLLMVMTTGEVETWRYLRCRYSEMDMCGLVTRSDIVGVDFTGSLSVTLSVRSKSRVLV